MVLFELPWSILEYSIFVWDSAQAIPNIILPDFGYEVVDYRILP